MTYVKWNNLIGEYFFGDIENQGKTIFLYLNKEILLDLASKTTGNKDTDELWKDFINVINNPVIEPNESRIETRFSSNSGSYTSRLRTLNAWARVNDFHSTYPIYLCFLLMPIIAKAERQAGNDANVRKTVRVFFEENDIRFSKDDFSNGCNDVFYYFCESTNGYNGYDGGLWKELFDWSKVNDRGYTYFNFIPNGKQYVNMISDQCLLTKKNVIHVRELYDKAGLNANGIYSYLDFKAHLLRQRTNFRYYFKKETVKQLRSNSKKEDRLFRVLYSDFNDWDGYFESVDENTSKRRNVHSHYIYVCVSVDEDKGTFKKEYRLHEDIVSPLSIEYADGKEGEILSDHNGWSTILHSPYVRSVTSEHQENKFKFNESPNDVYLFERDDYIPGIVLVSRTELIYEGTTALFFITKHHLENTEKITKMELSNDEGYYLYRYDNVEKTDDIIANGILKDYIYIEDEEEPCRFHLKGGLVIHSLHHTVGYMTSFLPVICGNAESLFIHNNEEKISLQRIIHNSYDEDVWQLPKGIKPDNYHIDDSNKTLRILSKDELYIPSVDYPVRDGQGHKLCLKSKITDEIKAKRIIFDNIISVQGIGEDNTAAISKSSNAVITSDETSFNPTFGDILIDWLYWCGECPKEQFREGYIALQHAQEESNPDLKIFAGRNNWYTALRWLIKGCYVDYDRDRKKIIPLKPRFVLLPVDEKEQSNKMRLVGCRSIDLINKLQEECKRHDFLGFHFFYPSYNYMQERLTPSSIFIEVKGNELNDFGLDSVDKYVCEPLQIEKAQRNYLPSLYQVMLKQSDLDEQNWIDINLNRYSDIERCFFFNKQTMSYDKMSYRFIDLPDNMGDYALVKIELANQEYDYAIIKSKERKYLSVEDEALGKLYVASKQAGPGQTSNKIKVIMEGRKCTILVARRMDLPIPLAKYMNIVSTNPHLKWDDREQLNYYVYPLLNGVDKNFLIRMIEDVTTLTLTKIEI